MWHAFDANAPYINALGNTISARLQRTIESNGQACIAVSGGRSPIALFDRLSRCDINWEKIHVTLVDERFVAPDDEDSNERLVRDHLLVNQARRAKFTGLVTDPASIQNCVERANQAIQSVNLAILGMGDDGHTASLFPGAPQLAQALSLEQTHRYMRITPPAAAHERISMTLAALLHAEQLILAISGPHKRKIYEQAAQKRTPELPVSFLITQSLAPLDVYWHA
jgi:6-phosphogluconolactonase